MREIEECQCPQAGYCEFFRQEMTYDPPNWQWCQGTSKQERNKYRIDCDKKHARKNFGNSECKFITGSNLVDDCIKKFIPKLSKLGIRGIVGVPRSGFLPASICATTLNLPLYTFSDKKLVICNSLSDFGGYRMMDYNNSAGKLLVVDDTVFSGDTLDKIKCIFGTDYYYGAIYCTPGQLECVDVYGEELNEPHLLEWHFFNSAHTEQTLFDLDGVFSPNVPVSVIVSDDKYEKYISNVEPFYHRLPRTHKLKAIVTGRLDKFRKTTEEWLKKYNIRYQDLIMYPTEKKNERDANHVQEVGRYKADVYRRSGTHFFMESEKNEGVVIRQFSEKRVILPNDGLIL